MVDVPGKDPVPVVLDYPDTSTNASMAVVLGHGAGGDMDSGNLPAFAKAVTEAGLPCLRYTVKPPNLALRVQHCKVCAAARPLTCIDNHHDKPGQQAAWCSPNMSPKLRITCKNLGLSFVGACGLALQ